MTQEDEGAGHTDLDEISEEIGRKAERKRRARARGPMGLWFGFGMFGLVGWSVAVPMVIGIALGVFLDRRLDSGFSWTLTLLFAGLFVGCVIAWYWVRAESRKGEENEL